MKIQGLWVTAIVDTVEKITLISDDVFKSLNNIKVGGQDIFGGNNMQGHFPITFRKSLEATKLDKRKGDTNHQCHRVFLFTTVNNPMEKFFCRSSE